MSASANEPFVFADVARVPANSDNVAIALRTLSAGDRILIRQLVFEFAHTILEGHRFAIHRIRKGDPLLSWGLPFGLATRDIEPGEYVCNEKILNALAERSIDIKLPKAANFLDHRLAFTLDEARFKPAHQVTSGDSPLSFRGFRRNPRRGAGTRNYIVILGASSRTAGFVRQLAERFKNIRSRFSDIDGVVAVGHTEAGSDTEPQNLGLTLKTLAGFMVNPNVGAVLCVDFGNELLSNKILRDYLHKHGYPMEDLLHDFFSIGSTFESALDSAEKNVKGWLPVVNSHARESLTVADLRLGLQCGGSDAFSGISANPLVGILSRQTVAHGGSANLAETDELIGAESYVLEKVRDLETARAFLKTIDRFQDWAALHGHSAEGNPSGGNMFRGLYNITIKSIGAARKKDPATRLDYVIDYGELMTQPGFYFMNSPGNDLESIAGQVAAGCNMILFATGNGSITNFPFVPTLKYMTTTRRFELVRNEMDFNAGRYLDGESLEALGQEAFAQLLRVASGELSAGERAGHSQVQLWREWRGSVAGPLAEDERSVEPVAASTASDPLETDAVSEGLRRSIVPERVALILPTSLCSGQVANLIAEKLNTLGNRMFSRAIALPHTEGCGNSAGDSEKLFLRTMAGYLAHPFIGRAVLLEHGCEKTHNDAFLHTLRDLQIDPSQYGFASIQLDGGIERVTRKVMKQFSDEKSEKARAIPFSVGFAAQQAGPLERAVIDLLTSAFHKHAITTVVPESLVTMKASLDYGERFVEAGMYVMRTPTNDLVEIMTGLVACGVQMIVSFASNFLVPANPLVPTVQIAERDRLPAGLHSDVDLLYASNEHPQTVAKRILRTASEIRSGRKRARSAELGNTAFQVTRGYTGISL